MGSQFVLVIHNIKVLIKLMKIECHFSGGPSRHPYPLGIIFTLSDPIQPIFPVIDAVMARTKMAKEVFPWPFIVIPLGQLVILLGVILSY